MLIKVLDNDPLKGAHVQGFQKAPTTDETHRLLYSEKSATLSSVIEVGNEDYKKTILTKL